MRYLALLPCLLLASPQMARAAQDSTVITENAPIRADPRDDGKALEYLPMGSEVRVSSYPMPGGWYKIRSKTGAYGWIHESFLSVYKPPPESAARSPEELAPRPERDRRFFLRGLAGFDFFQPADLNALFGFSELNTGYTVGGEAGMFISERVSIALRSEALVKDIVAKEQVSGIQFNLALRAYPIMGGMEFYPWKLPALRFSIGIFGGVALAASFSTQANSLPAPNVMVLQRSPFTSLIRGNLSRPLGRIVSVFLEAGYRYLKTEAIDTTSASGIQGGTPVFARYGAFQPRVIDLSGAELAAGLGIHF